MNATNLMHGIKEDPLARKEQKTDKRSPLILNNTSRIHQPTLSITWETV